MNDIEKEIQAKGLTAPRITPAEIEANIASEHYFTAKHGINGAMNEAELHQRIPDAMAYAHGCRQLECLTFCVIMLKNGFIVTGESACAHPDNFDAEIGRMIAKTNALTKVWPLMGYALKDRLAHAGQSTPG
ncbi:Gp49 family protein [Massilia sp. W12]|uniref:Gp49 family protein n=1 Tax=Massilia sp. W12 TaxID=3126507 RepID=UPI0030D0F13F